MASDAEDDDLEALRLAALASRKKPEPVGQVISSISSITRVPSQWQDFPANHEAVSEFAYQPELIPEPSFIPDRAGQLIGRPHLPNRQGPGHTGPWNSPVFNNGMSHGKPFRARGFYPRGSPAPRGPHRTFGDRGRPIQDRGRFPRRGYSERGRRGFFNNRGRGGIQVSDSDVAAGNLIVICRTGPSEEGSKEKQDPPAQLVLTRPQDKYHGEKPMQLSADTDMPSKPRDKFSRYNDSDSEEEDDWIDNRSETDDIIKETDLALEDDDDITDLAELENKEPLAIGEDGFQVEIRTLDVSDTEEQDDKTSVKDLEEMLNETDGQGKEVLSNSQSDSDSESLDLDALAADDSLDILLTDEPVSLDEKVREEIVIEEKSSQKNSDTVLEVSKDTDSIIDVKRTRENIEEENNGSSLSSSSSSSSSSSEGSSDEEEDKGAKSENEKGKDGDSVSHLPSSKGIKQHVPDKDSIVDKSDTNLPFSEHSKRSPMISESVHRLRTPSPCSSLSKAPNKRKSPPPRTPPKRSTSPVKPQDSQRYLSPVSPDESPLRSGSNSDFFKVRQRQPGSPNQPRSPGQRPGGPNRKSPYRRPLLQRSRSPGKQLVSRSPGRRPISRSPGRRPISRSPGRRPISRSPGRRPASRSPGRRPVSRSPGRRPRSPLLRGSPQRRGNSPIRKPLDYRRGSRYDNYSDSRRYGDKGRDRYSQQDRGSRGGRHGSYERSRRSRSRDRQENRSWSRDRKERRGPRDYSPHPVVRSPLRLKEEKAPRKEETPPHAIDLDKLPPEEREKIEARRKKFCTSEVKIDPMKKVSLKSIKERKRRKRSSGDKDTAPEEKEEAHEKSQRKKKKMLKEEVKEGSEEQVEEGSDALEEEEEEQVEEELPELEDEESEDSDEGRAWKEEGKKFAKHRISLNAQKKIAAPLVSLDRIAVKGNHDRLEGKRGRFEGRWESFKPRDHRGRGRHDHRHRHKRDFVSDEEEDNVSNPSRLSSSIVNTKPFKVDIPPENLKVEIHVSSKERKKKSKVKPDFSQVYSVPAKRHHDDEEESEEDMPLLETPKKIKKKKKEKKKKKVKERIIEHVEAQSDDEQSPPPPSPPRPSILERLGRKVPLAVEKEKKKKKKKSKAGDEPDLDLHMQKMKEKNEAILRRRREIELDKEIYG